MVVQVCIACSPSAHRTSDVRLVRLYGSLRICNAHVLNNFVHSFDILFRPITIAHNSMAIHQLHLQKPATPMSRQYLRDVEQFEGTPNPAINLAVFVQHSSHAFAALAAKRCGKGRGVHVLAIAYGMIKRKLVVGESTNPETPRERISQRAFEHFTREESSEKVKAANCTSPCPKPPTAAKQGGQVPVDKRLNILRHAHSPPKLCEFCDENCGAAPQGSHEERR
mmetsp:Transcript_89524/g.158917  ORF Transcript_89524/g.158917 Transcript_89524/m.158917 type:complete len:224 (-) Transcript_89524:128-799(-)